MMRRARALLFVAPLLTWVACAKPVNDGGACFQNSECRSESICTQTVYGKFCMQRCLQETPICASGASCLRAEDVPTGGVGGSAGAGGEAGAGGAAGAGGEAGAGGDAGAGGGAGAGGDAGAGGAAGASGAGGAGGEAGAGGASGGSGAGGAAGSGGAAGAGGGSGTGGASGAGGAAGAGGDGGPTIYACLPGRYEIPGYVPRIIGQVCDFSMDCELGTICVCIPGAICEGEGKNGPTCQRTCDPNILNQCPQINNIQPQCTDLGDGRGFCDTTTVTLPE